MPWAFYTDAVHALLMSMLHQDISIDLVGHSLRSRFWSMATAEPGSRKSPAFNLLR